MSTALVILAPISVTALSASITVLKIAFDTVVFVKDVTGFIVSRIWYGENVCETCREREEKEFTVLENKQRIVRQRIILNDILPEPDNTPVHL
jgi:hypothetical protein